MTIVGMKKLMSAAAMREAAIDFLRTIASIPRRTFFWLLLAGVAGYSYGYQDAFRGPESLGWRFGDVVDRFMPEAVHEARRQNAERLRNRMRQGLEVPQ
ncbi:MAG TPA: hypothetical protein VIP11_17920 [Gemmatimonadaceae bacterium]